MFVLWLNDPCLRGVQNTVGEEKFFREGSHLANLDITPRNLQMGTVVKEKKKRLAKKWNFYPGVIDNYAIAYV